MQSESVNQFLLLDKPTGLSSAACVGKVKRAFGLHKTMKIGHTGTLDPFASGLLPIAMGKATRLIEYLPKKKAYAAVLKLGEATDTLDLMGTLVDQKKISEDLDEKVFQELFFKFIGRQKQVPPVYSAIKVAGKPLYRYAREGKADLIERQEREIEIESLDLLQWKSPFLSFKVNCSPGTYIRVLGEDIARELGTFGHLTALRRLQSDGFAIDRAISLETVIEGEKNENAFISIESALSHLPTILLQSEAEEVALRQGKPNLLSRERVSAEALSGPVLAMRAEKAIAILRAGEGDFLKIEKVI